VKQLREQLDGEGRIHPTLPVHTEWLTNRSTGKQRYRYL
jgi:hypothetical protein